MRRCLSLILFICVAASTAAATIYDRNGNPIPGTSNITPGPNVNCQFMTLPSAELGHMSLYNANFNHSALTNADFTYSDLTAANFYYATLTSADFTGATILNANFQQETGFTSQQLYSTASYQGCNLSGTNFSYDNLNAWSFYGQNCTGGSFAYSTLTGANFTGATVKNAYFTGTTSKGFTASQLYATASYSNNDLTGIKLDADVVSGWSFAGMNLTNASFSGSTITGANFTGATIGGANFNNVTGLTQAQFDATASYNTGNLLRLGPFGPGLDRGVLQFRHDRDDQPDRRDCGGRGFLLHRRQRFHKGPALFDRQLQQQEPGSDQAELRRRLGMGFHRPGSVQVLRVLLHARGHRIYFGQLAQFELLFQHSYECELRRR